MKTTMLDKFTEFMQQTLSLIDDKKIDISNLRIDHIGYQTSSAQDYMDKLNQVQKIGIIIHEEVVNSRRVCAVELNSPLIYQQHVIDLVEIVEPSPGQICPSALEHIEIIVNSSLQEFIAQYPKLDWNVSGISHPVFPMVKLKLSEFTQVKFHLQDVKEIFKKQKELINS